MSHDTSHGTSDKPKTPSTAAFFAVLIFIGFILGLINFTQSMGHDDSGHGAAAHAEHEQPSHSEAGSQEHH